MRTVNTANKLQQSSNGTQPEVETSVSDMAGQTMNGSQIMIQTLADLDVDTIFGYPGGANIPIYNELYDNEKLHHVLVRHEQAGAHAADGYARATGKPGVVLVTSGPGGTNTVTGIATAAMDSIPMLVFTGQVPTNMIGNDAFQEADICGITRPITKYNYLVKDINDLERVIREAHHIATTGRPGPVLIDLPKDMIKQEAKYNGVNKVSLPTYQPVTQGHHSQIKKAAKLLSEAKKPLIYAGGGVLASEAWEELTAFAERNNIPVTTTLMGLGCFPESKPQALGMLGMHGTWYANMAITECDALLAVGARFDDRVTGRLDGFSPNSRKIHIDIDPSCIAQNVPVEVPIVGDAKNILAKLDENTDVPDTKEWWDTINKWKEEHPLRVPEKDNEISPQRMVQGISDATKGEAIVVTDVGQHQMWTAQHYKFNHPRSWMSSGGLGTMGYGFPAAVGAAMAQPDRKVVCITGDGGFQMTSYELSTAVEQELPIIVAVMNNNFLGMVRQWQELFHDKRYSSTDLRKGNPDFVKLAESYGAVGLRATKPSEIESVMKEAMNVKDRPVVIDFVVTEEENCYPMVPSGAALNEMIEG